MKTARKDNSAAGSIHRVEDLSGVGMVAQKVGKDEIDVSVVATDWMMRRSKVWLALEDEHNGWQNTAHYWAVVWTTAASRIPVTLF